MDVFSDEVPMWNVMTAPMCMMCGKQMEVSGGQGIIELKCCKGRLMTHGYWRRFEELDPIEQTIMCNVLSLAGSGEGEIRDAKKLRQELFGRKSVEEFDRDEVLAKIRAWRTLQEV
jgi:hypothetical protein